MVGRGNGQRKGLRPPNQGAEGPDPHVLGAVIRRARDTASHRADDQGEEKQLPRMLRIGELEADRSFRPYRFRRDAC